MDKLDHLKSYIESALHDLGVLEIKGVHAGMLFGIQNALGEAYNLIVDMKKEAISNAES